MNNERWKPSVTVAAVIEQAGRFLLVEELTPEGVMLNNPAGHLDPGESPFQAVVRETLEETARTSFRTRCWGIYLSRFQRPSRSEDVTYLRLAFTGTVGDAIDGWVLDKGILRNAVDDGGRNPRQHAPSTKPAGAAMHRGPSGRPAPAAGRDSFGPIAVHAADQGLNGRKVLGVGMRREMPPAQPAPAGFGTIEE